MDAAAPAEAKSKITAMKPHFFKPLLPGFLHGLLIPLAFFKNYLNHHGKSKNHEMAVLRTVLGEWKVKIKDGRFIEEEGWRDFADHHSLHVGDMVVFRYEGELVFYVTIFDSTACERIYDHHHQPQVFEVKQEISLQKSTDSDDDLQACVVEQKKKVVNNNSAKSSSKVAAASSSSQAYPWFTSTLSPSNLEENRFFIPLGFARSNGLCNRRCEMLILDDSERKSWQVKLSHKSGRVYMGGHGFKEVVAENGLKAGDDISFELISGGSNPVMVFHPPRPSSHKSKRATATYPEAKEAMKLPSHTPQCLKVKKEIMKPRSSQSSNCFISTVTRASIVRSRLYIPRQFARWHGLNKCRNMTIEDPREHLWPVSLRYWTNRLRVTQGWKAIALANELKDGQEIKLELVKEGKTPMMKLSVCGSEAVGIGLGKEEAECSLSLRDGHRSETLAGVLFPVSEVAAAAHPVPPPLSNA